MKTNTPLAVAAAILVALSAFSYVESVQRAERFARGQHFLPNLNPDEVAGIAITKGEESTRLERSGDRFVLPEEHDYPAKNDAVNRFLRDLLQIELEQEVGDDERLAEELGLTDEASESRTEIALLDAQNGDMVRFVMNDAPGDVGGTYLRRIDGVAPPVIYRSSKRVYLQTGASAFLDQQILDVEGDDLLTIQGGGFVFEREVDPETNEATGELKLANLGADQRESARANQLISMLKGLRFQKHHLADDPVVQDLDWDGELVYRLKDGSGYDLQVATKDDKYYLRIRATFEDAPMTIALDADEDEVRETSEKLSRQDEVREFNAFHGSWIYEVTEITAEKVRYGMSDLVENS